jgi:hypothetical protein
LFGCSRARRPVLRSLGEGGSLAAGRVIAAHDLLGLARSFKCFPNPTRISSTIKNAKHDRFVGDHPVVDGKRKPSRKQPVVAEMDAVDAGIENQGIDLGEKAIEKIGANS